MRATVIIVCGTALLALGLLISNHLKRSTPVTSPKSWEQVSAVNPPRPRLPAPRLSVAPSKDESTAESTQNTNLWSRLMNGDFPRVSAEQPEAYLQKHHRSAESLLGAYAATGDRAFLREALEKHPNDPRLNLAAYYHGDAWAAETSAPGYDRKRPASAERRQLLDALAKAAPDNALPCYLAALDSFKGGQSDEAVEQLVAAAQKSKFQDYTLEFMQNAEEAHRAAGWSDAEAKAVANSSAQFPHLAELRDTATRLVELAALYRQAGDEASAQAAEQIGWGLGQRLTQPGQLTMIQELVGIAIERKILGSMDPNRALDSTGQTVQSRLDALAQRKQTINALVPTSDVFLNLSEPDLSSYFDRIKLFGETAAAEWLLTTHGK